jgi:dethiobiotin synthetase
MNRALVVTGTDTDIGKTVAAAALVSLLEADYWKPIQAGLDGETDRETVIRLTGIDAGRAHPETYRLRTTASPHRAAERDGMTIDTATLTLPKTQRPLVIEPAGGLLVPLSREVLQIDVIARWRKPVVLVTATRLGTINHTLLSVEALRTRAIAIAGLIFMGEENCDTQRTIAEFAQVATLGRLPDLDPLDHATLRQTAATCLDLAPLHQAWETTP